MFVSELCVGAFRADGEKIPGGAHPGDDLVWGCSCPSRKLCSHIRRVVRPLAAVKAVRMENGVLRLASGDELRG
jgi:hypothetical protein